MRKWIEILFQEISFGYVLIMMYWFLKIYISQSSVATQLKFIANFSQNVPMK